MSLACQRHAENQDIEVLTEEVVNVFLRRAVEPFGRDKTVGVTSSWYAVAVILARLWCSLWTSGVAETRQNATCDGAKRLGTNA